MPLFKSTTPDAEGKMQVLQLYGYGNLVTYSPVGVLYVVTNSPPKATQSAGPKRYHGNRGNAVLVTEYQ